MGDDGIQLDGEQSELAAFGPFRLFPGARLLERDGKPVEIGGRALDVLIELVRHAGRVVSKTELMSSIWADTTVVEGVLRTHMYNLRKAIGDGVNGARYVTSVAGRGYCFVAPVVRQAANVVSSSTGSGTRANSLPPRLARMAGRDETVRTIASQLLRRRFVTIVGAAGIGKTTVAIAAGHALLEQFGGACRFIELGEVTDPARVAATIASTLGVAVHTDEALPSLQAFLRDKRVLLVLDNCEHLVDAAARLAEQLFLHTQHVHLLVTSREALRVEGEFIHRLGPLATPDAHECTNAEAALTYPSVQVFLERAAASGWADHLTDADVPIVAEICARLDGVALAIELAASFVGERGLLGTAQMLDDRLSLLWHTGRRTAPPRQQTLHALIAWSFDRLLERERLVLRRLSVFSGAFRIDAARAVVLEPSHEGEHLLDVLSELAGKSLLSPSVESGGVVHRMLETTRVYALERLREQHESEVVGLRHALYFTEHPSDLANVRAALHWGFSTPSGQAAGVRLAAAAAQMMLDRGLVSECHDWCGRALDALPECDAGTLVELRLRDARVASAMYAAKAVDQSIRFHLDRGLALSRALDSGDHEVRLLGHLNNFLIRTGDWRGAVEVAKDSMAAAGRTQCAGVLRAHWMLAISHHCAGHHALAQQHCEEGLRLAATSGEEPMMNFRHSHAVLTLARTLWLRGESDRSLAVARPVIDALAALVHPVDKSIALLLAVPLFFWHGDWNGAEHLVEMMEDHVERYSLASHKGIAIALRGELLVRTGRAEDGCRLLRAADSSLKATGNASHTTYLASALAEGLAAMGALDEAIATIAAAIDEAERRGGTWDQPELLRLKGVFLARCSSADETAIADAFSSSIALAQRQGALALERRARDSLALERSSEHAQVATRSAFPLIRLDTGRHRRRAPGR